MLRLLLRRGRRLRAIAALCLATALLAITLAGGDRSEGQTAKLGDENSWLRIQNVGSLPAHIDLNFFDPAGRLVAKDGCPRTNVCDAITSGSGRSFFQQTFTGLPVGYRGSGYVVSDQPFTGLMARDVLRPDGSYQISGDSLRLGAGVAEYFLPVIANNAWYVSRISIENTSATADACVQIIYYPDASLSQGQADPAGGSGGCPQGGERIGAKGTMLRDELNIAAPFGFDGSARVRTFATGGGTPASAQQLAVMVDTRARLGTGLATYRGIGSDEVSRVVLLPMVDLTASEGQSQFSTRFRIMNINPALPNDVTLRFSGRDATGVQLELEATVTVNGVLTCDQRAQQCLPPNKALPPSFFGSVRMQAVNPIAVIVQRLSGDGSLADYRGFTGLESSTQVVLPVVDKNFGPFGGKLGWNSWFRVLAIDGSAAQVYVVYYGAQFPAGLFPQGSTRVGPEGLTFRQWEDNRLPDGFVGSAVVIADRPVLVVANLESDVFTGDPVMLYNGIPIK